jgi:general secretion pathway protein M
VNAALPTGTRGKVLALGLLLVALAAVYSVVAVPLLDLYADNAAQAERRRALVAKLAAIAGELPALRARVAQLRTASASSKLTLEGGSDAIAAAALQGRIKTLATTAGVTIGSTESLPSEMQDGYRRLGLRLVLNGSYEGVVKLLAEIETTTPPLLVDNLQMRSFQRRPGGTPVSTIDASFDVYGFRAADNAEAAKR